MGLVYNVSVLSRLNGDRVGVGDKHCSGGRVGVGDRHCKGRYGVVVRIDTEGKM